MTKNSAMNARLACLPDLGAKNIEEAIRIVRSSNRIDRFPAQKMCLMAYLEGRKVPDMCRETGLSDTRIYQLIRKGAQNIKIGLEVADSESEIIKTLTRRSTNCLINENLTSDHDVGEYVRKHGAQSLLKLPNLGKVSYVEICTAFGFDQDERVKVDPERTTLVEQDEISPDHEKPDDILKAAYGRHKERYLYTARTENPSTSVGGCAAARRNQGH